MEGETLVATDPTQGSCRICSNFLFLYSFVNSDWYRYFCKIFIILWYNFDLVVLEKIFSLLPNVIEKCKVEKILKGSLVSMPSQPPPFKIQIMGKLA